MRKLYTTVAFVLSICLLIGCFAGCDSSKDAEPTQSELSTQPDLPTMPALEEYIPQQTVVATEETGDPEQILAARRDLVEQEMRRMCSVLWTPSTLTVYHMASRSDGIEEAKKSDAKHVITFIPGEIYRGLPYTQGGGSGYGWVSHALSQDDNGVYTLDTMTTESLSGGGNLEQFNVSRMGNDCADQLFWAWAVVANSITFSGTSTMTEETGVLKVGEYETSGKYSANNNTYDIVERNGREVMYKAYAQLRKGDGMVNMTRGGSGHAVMIVSCDPVFLADGSIDPLNSTVTILEQTGANEIKQNKEFDERVGKEVFICEKLDTVWTFEEVFASGYLPVTCKELVDASPRAAVEVTDSNENPTVDNMFTGNVKSNYRISHITIRIYDAGDNLVQKAICYARQAEKYSFDLLRFLNPLELPNIRGSVNLDALVTGTYRCTYTATVSTGDEVMFRDFSITME